MLNPAVYDSVQAELQIATAARDAARDTLMEATNQFDAANARVAALELVAQQLSLHVDEVKTMVQSRLAVQAEDLKS